MRNKTIIVIYGRQNEGKSETIKRICQLILSDFPYARPSKTPDYSGVILLSIQIGNIKIGIESQGDPNSRMLNQDTIRKLADKNEDPILGGCDIIICTTRTGGKTVHKVDEIANDYAYHTLWMSSFFSPKLNKNVLNNLAAKNCIEVIKSLVVGQF